MPTGDMRARELSAAQAETRRTTRARQLRSIFSPTHLALAAFGVLSFVLYRRAEHLAPGAETISAFVTIALVQCALYAAAVVVAWRGRTSRTTLLLVVVFAALFRLALLFDAPRLSDDIYRYVWDGRVQAAGVNPYRYVPADPALASLRDAAIYEHINRRDYAPTIYPPVAQMIFFAATRVSEAVVWMKCVMVAFEAVALWAISMLLASFNLPRQRVLVAAWHPLAVWEIAGGGHLDAILICFVCLALLARRRGGDTLTGVWLACAALTKFFPIVLAPALYRRWGWRMPAAFLATCAVAYLPYIWVGARVFGFLSGYADEEGLQSGTRFYLLTLARKAAGAGVPNAAFDVFALVVLGVLAAWALWKRESAERSFVARALVIATAFTVLLSPRYSWYFVWLVPFLSLVPPALAVPVLYLTAANFLLYLSWLGDAPERMFVFHTIIYLPFAALCVISWYVHKRKQG
ncbi:MAG: glycosyltransferase 87 family protein [Pyrinomonadaceae bacterium]